MSYLRFSLHNRKTPTHNNRHIFLNIFFGKNKKITMSDVGFVEYYTYPIHKNAQKMKEGFLQKNYFSKDY